MDSVQPDETRERPPTPFGTAYHRWNIVHSSVITALVVAAQVPVLSRGALLLLTAWIPLSFAVLYRTAGRLHPDGAGPALPNLLTASRTVASAAVVALAAIDTYAPGVGTFMRSSAALMIAAGLGLVEVTDFLDGYLAHKLGSGSFGATWDMESDAIFVLGLAVGLGHFHAAGVPVLIIGLMRYLYVLVWRYDGDPIDVPGGYKMFAKTVTAIIVVSLIVGFLPFIPAKARVIGYGVVLGLQAVSFGWDLVLQRASSRG